MGYRLEIWFGDRDTDEITSTELIDEVFETYADAEAEYDSWVENYSYGNTVLKAAGEDDVDDDDIIGYEIWDEDEE